MTDDETIDLIVGMNKDRVEAWDKFLETRDPADLKEYKKKTEKTQETLDNLGFGSKQVVV